MFEVEQENFIKNGKFEYKFDEGNNVVLNTSSSNYQNHFISLPIRNVTFVNKTVSEFTDATFSTFIPDNINVQASIRNASDITASILVVENATLRNELGFYISQSNANPSDDEKIATKQVILELRKQLGEGNVDSDFTETFPYTVKTF